ncbi:MAG TPA: CRISPR-associated endonuclease Cas1 [Chloroflexota bacterium]|nr:CRISPR-associated endonuclease Cas1 [Chloroflexota bacterium]
MSIEQTSIVALPELVPARMVNEFVYCPRLFYLEWVQTEFSDSADTLDGRSVHRRTDRTGGELPAAGSLSESDKFHARSVELSSERIGVIARIDLVEADGNQVTPVDYKRGQPPRDGTAWETDLVQVCLQALILRDNEYQVDQAIVYYAAAKKRVLVPITDELVARTTALLPELRRTANGPIPPPLVDSPKCPRCSLVGICLPDEVNLLAGQSDPRELRRLVPARDDALPVYVQAQGASIGKSGDQLQVRRPEEPTEEIRLLATSQLSVFGNVQVTAAALRELCAREIPICHFTYGGWFSGITRGLGGKNVELRLAQYRAALDPAWSLDLARRLVAGKILNCRTLLRRNDPGVPPAVLASLQTLARRAEQAESLQSLLGIEGAAARSYFGEFAGMLKTAKGAFPFDFGGRNRRPPRDPVNAVLSFLYAFLVKDLTLATFAVGFDPFLGFYHQPRYGRPALALDLVEEFRPLVADSVAITLINNGEVRERDFIHRAGAVSLTTEGRRAVIAAYERRMETSVTHPVFGYQISYRRVLEVQARLLARSLGGEIPAYPAFRTR